MKKHGTNEAAETYRGTECLYCKQNFTNMYVCRRHMERACKQNPDKTVDAKITKNVDQNTQNVTQIAQIVTQKTQNVTQNAQNVVEMENGKKFTCVKCNKQFARGTHLSRHFETCKGVHSLQCELCLQTFANRHAKCKHKKTCVGMIEGIKEISETDNNRINIVNNITNNGSIINVGNVQVVQNVYVNDWGSESMHHITNDVIKKRLREINGIGITNLIIDTHFNSNLPQNHNIRMYQGSHKFFHVKINEQWYIKLRDEVFDMLTRRYKDVLQGKLYDDNFNGYLKQNGEYEQIVQSLSKFDKKKSTDDYYSCVGKVLCSIKQINELYKPSIKPSLVG